MINIEKSKLRSKLFAYYFNHPGVELYLRELARAIDEDPANLLRELNALEKDGVFISVFCGKQRYFTLNKNYLFYNELKNIAAKTVGAESEIKKKLSKINGIKLCFIYGSYANGAERAESDIDLLVLGDKIDSDLLVEKINKLEKKIGREINYRLFSIKDFQKALREKNSFILNIIKKKKVFLLGNEKDIGKFN